MVVCVRVCMTGHVRKGGGGDRVGEKMYDSVCFTG